MKPTEMDGMVNRKADAVECGLRATDEDIVDGDVDELDNVADNTCFDVSCLSSLK